jgi:hypothetical protein
MDGLRDKERELRVCVREERKRNQKRKKADQIAANTLPRRLLSTVRLLGFIPNYHPSLSPPRLHSSLPIVNTKLLTMGRVLLKVS